MNIALIGLLILMVVVAMTMLRRRTRPAPPSTATTHRNAAPGALHPPLRPAPAPVAPAPCPAVNTQRLPLALAGFRFTDKDALDIDTREALLSGLHQLPRPPLALHQLVSPAFLEHATSNEISDLIMADALLAAKVLALVNSPFYGLSRPVLSIGQAVTFLGLNSIRTICLAYLLQESFTPISQARKATFNTIMQAATLAGELCNHLGQRLDLPERGSLSTQVILSFLGHLAAAALMPVASTEWTAANGLLERARNEQDTLGADATALGGLLMQDWHLPDVLIRDVEAIDHCLLTAAASPPTVAAQRQAAAYLCARLGERLARGSLTELARFDLDADDSAELFHLRGQFDPALLGSLLKSPDIGNTVERITAAARHLGNG